MKKRTFITLNTSEAERLRIQKMAERSGSKNVSDFIKTAIERYAESELDFLNKGIKEVEREVFKMIDYLQFPDELAEDQQELLNYLNFCYDLMARLKMCQNDKSNYVLVEGEMLDIDEEPHTRYRHAVSTNTLADVIISEKFNNRAIEKKYNINDQIL